MLSAIDKNTGEAINNGMYSIKPAKSNDASKLSDIASISKAHWGYPQEFVEPCRDDLMIDPADCVKGLVFLAEADKSILGFYRISGEAPSGVLEDLFVDPQFIGTGVGKVLLRHAMKSARGHGMTSLEIDSDPYAEEFYIHLGATRIGQVESSSMPGRFLPKLKLQTVSKIA